jgi:uncharacterized delta-60 repeat protein
MYRTTLHRASLLIVSLLLIASQQVAAQAGHLDPTFGHGGIVTTDFGQQTQSSNAATANAVAIQADGKIVVVGGIPNHVGFPVPAVARYNTNGSLDTSFGTSGIASIPSIEDIPLTSVALQSDGKIVGVGVNFVVRYLTNGTLDSAFGSAGIVSLGDMFLGEPLTGVVVQPDGKILVANHYLLRFLSNGQFDTSFGNGGIARTAGFPSNALALLASGKILVASSSGQSGFISQYESNGSLDTTFGIAGQLASPGTAAGVVLLGAGDFLAGGSLTNTSVQIPFTAPSGFAVSRFLGAGITDATFGTNGGNVTGVPNYPIVATSGLAVQASGDIVTLGTATTAGQTVFALARFTAAGQLDTTFGANGTVVTQFGGGIQVPSIGANGLAIQSDGKIVAVGGYTVFVPYHGFDTAFKIVRYLGQ